MFGLMPIDAIDIAIIIGIPVIITRIAVGLSHPKRVSKLWTFALPMFAMLIFFIRVSITRNFTDIIPAEDPIAVASWWGIVITQFIATIYQWTPAILIHHWNKYRGK